MVVFQADHIKREDNLWYAVTAQTPFGPIRGLLKGDKVGLSSMKAIDMDDFLDWGRQRFGDESIIKVCTDDSPESKRFRRDVNRLLHGKKARLSPDLSSNTAFQVTVAGAVQRIPFGHTASYGDVASAIGKPGGAQAVGQALPRLPFALFFPSHRVVRSSGESVGCTLLTFGLKSDLLRWEREKLQQSLVPGSTGEKHTRNLELT